MQALPGFRDFLPTDCAARNYIFGRWREVARRYGFVEWDGPVLEPTELYRKKSGDEIIGQLFNFTDKGEREVALRPELTPTLARIIAAHEREFKKPLKWFSIGSCFRYEKQQRGRLREHIQLNCDILGEPSIEADAELIAVSIDVLREFGFTVDDFVVRVNDRDIWVAFLDGHMVPREECSKFLNIIDKIDRVGEEEIRRRIEVFEREFDVIIPWLAVKDMLETSVKGAKDVSNRLVILFEKLSARGMGDFIQLDCSLVRGLAYYTSTVFELFDRRGKLRAVAGGGRYDNLIEQLSDGAAKLSAVGYAMGDVVLGELIRDRPAASQKMETAVRDESKIDIYVVIAKEERRPDAIAEIQKLRNRGYRVDYSLTPAKVGKQFQTAEDLGATIAVLYGDEWPQVKVKTLATREEQLVPNSDLFARIDSLLR
jgi:histidyl-tRNA synthetase